MKKYLTLKQVEIATQILNGNFQTWGRSQARLTFTINQTVTVSWETHLLKKENDAWYFAQNNSYDASHVRLEFTAYVSGEHENIFFDALHLSGKGSRDARNEAAKKLLNALNVEIF